MRGSGFSLDEADYEEHRQLALAAHGAHQQEQDDLLYALSGMGVDDS